jgi:hypothetical protein
LFSFSRCPVFSFLDLRVSESCNRFVFLFMLSCVFVLGV